MKKKDKAILFLKENVHLFQCPICSKQFVEVKGNQLQCINEHSFDVSKKGTVHFLLKQGTNEYDRKMLKDRAFIAKKGLWQPLLEEIMPLIEKPNGNHLDIGCGEGSHLNYLKELGLNGKKIGFDISKDAVNLAAAQFEDIFWCVADLAHSPFSSKQYDTLLNILSPSNYSEFNRLLKPNGQVIKVVPNTNYLKELREVLYKEDKPYSNKEVVMNFYNVYDETVEKSVVYDFKLSPEDIEPLLNMTPLGWHARKTAKATLLSNPFTSITVDLTVLIGKIRN